jgi:antitoxin (DNA-binding transcriptional repressor) of toxin-antitoxin stability system
MSTITVTSDQARINWRDMIDTAFAGSDVVIERYGKPMVAVVNYDQWQRMRRQFLAMLDQRSQEMRDGNYITQEQLDAELRSKGIIE